MSATLIIAGWWLLFGGTHMLLSSARVRPRLVDRLGERSFQAVYSPGGAGLLRAPVRVLRPP
jgi:hypothetical protein